MLDTLYEKFSSFFQRNEEGRSQRKRRRNGESVYSTSTEYHHNTPPLKRKKLTRSSAGSKSWLLSGFDLSKIINYVMGNSPTNYDADERKDEFSDDDRDVDITHISRARSFNNTSKQFNSSNFRKHVRSPLSQISNATVLDLTIDEDSDNDLQIVEQNTGNHTIDLTDDSPDDFTRFSRPENSMSPNISRIGSPNTITDDARLEEHRRYREMVSLYTNLDLPEYADSISPSTTNYRYRNSMDKSVNSINTVNSFSPNESFKKSPYVDLTDVDDSEDRDRSHVRRFNNFQKKVTYLKDSPKYGLHNNFNQSGSSIKTRPIFIDDDESDVTEIEDVISHDRRGIYSNKNNMKTNTSLITEKNSLTDFTWIDKFRTALDPVQLEREREILREEKRRDIAGKKRLGNIEKLKNEISENKSNEFIPLTEDMIAKVKDVWKPGNPRQTFASGFNSEITRSDLATLKDSTWLNDEVVNFYFNLIKERNTDSTNNLPKVHVFNTFFYPKVMKTGFSGVKRWTKKVDIFSMDLVLIPVHLGMHWCLAAIDLKNKQLIYYDSLKGNNTNCLRALKQYLHDEMKDKKKVTQSFDDWEMLIPKDIPEQMNGCDCGVFMCKYAEYKSRYAPFTFTQANMSYFRKRMVYEIISKKLM